MYIFSFCSAFFKHLNLLLVLKIQNCEKSNSQAQILTNKNTEKQNFVVFFKSILAARFAASSKYALQIKEIKNIKKYKIQKIKCATKIHFDDLVKNKKKNTCP